MWLISHNVILTKDNLLKRKWQGDPKCRFCPENETITHMFFECSMAKFVWSLVAMVVGSNCKPCSFDLINTGNGCKNTWLVAQNFTWWGWQQSAGPFGELVTTPALRKTGLISYRDRLLSLILSCLFGRRWKKIFLAGNEKKERRTTARGPCQTGAQASTRTGTTRRTNAGGTRRAGRDDLRRCFAQKNYNRS